MVVRVDRNQVSHPAAADDDDKRPRGLKTNMFDLQEPVFRYHLNFIC